MADGEQTLTRKIQLKELEILKVFQDICRRHNLRYFAIGGTCLGAVRHKGFIPWDDDIDVGMPYEDYKEFLRFAENELPEKYKLIGHKNTRHYELSYSLKMTDSSTTIIEKGREHLPDRYCGVFIDVFPVHGIKNRTLTQKLILSLSRTCNRFNYKQRLQFRDMHTAKSLFLWFLLAPMRILLPYYFFSSIQENILKRYPFGCSDKIIFPWRDKKPCPEGWYTDIFFYDDFMNLIELPFEDTTISVPCGYDRYLSMEFGNYMQLPPEDKRKAMHLEGSIIDLDKPYTYYQEHAEAVK